ncbi:MAG: LuxR C-terminal-related transcriptional regulator [Candidatus Sulfotelmatobacter sp.]
MSPDPMFIDGKGRDNKIRVLVADSSRIHTHLLADVLKRDPLLEVIPFDSDSGSLVAAVTGLNIDVLVISANLEEQPARGLEILRDLRPFGPRVRAVVLMDSLKDEVVLNAFRVGARGIFSKRQPVELLCKCVHCVYQGQVWASSREMALALDALASAPIVRAVNAHGLSLLSKRELQVVRCLAEGLSNRQIAERLKLSQHTVKNHLFRVFDKLGVSSRIELLFMTMTQPVSGQSVAETSTDSAESGARDEFALLQKAAEAGLPAAQLALAQMYLVRRSDPSDVVRAYSWYLVALERAAQAKGLITKMLTAKQIEEAHREALAKLSQPGAEINMDWSSGRLQEGGFTKA